MADPAPGLDLDAVRRFADLAVSELSAAREEIDALNVYPVPDGDTGTNMYLTVEAARDAMREAYAAAPEDAVAAVAAFARGALLGARGNSGVILSELIGVFLRRLGRAEPGERAPVLTAVALQAASDAAYAAVGTPVEGTILTVARAAAEGAAAVVEQVVGDDIVPVLAAAAAAATEALARTPEQLPLLAAAGVVDAGGRGLCVVLDAAESALTGRRQQRPRQVVGTSSLPQATVPTGDLTAEGPAYEVMYLLAAQDDGIAGLRERLQSLGDSLVVVGGDGLWNVHVHVDDVGAAIEAGIAAGTPRRIQVTHFAEQIARAREERERSDLRGRALVAVAAGPGLARLFEDEGATVVSGGPGRRPSTGEILAAISATGAQEVIVLPNDPDSVGVAQAAARAAADTGAHVVVVPTRAQVQGIAALACHEPSRPLETDIAQMSAAAGGTRHGAVTIAAKDAWTSAGQCRAGDALGVVQGDFAVVGQDLAQVATEVLEQLLVGGGDLVTLVVGVDAAGRPAAEACQAWLTVSRPGVDVQVFDGGQDRYPLLLAVE